MHEISNKIRIYPGNGHCPWNLLFVREPICTNWKHFAFRNFESDLFIVQRPSPPSPPETLQGVLGGSPERIGYVTGKSSQSIFFLIFFFISWAGFTNYSAHFCQDNIAGPHSKCFQSVQSLSFWADIWGLISILQFSLEMILRPHSTAPDIVKR